MGKKRLSPKVWAQIRKKWESDKREGYSWLVDELDAVVSYEAIRKRADREGWSKVDLHTINNSGQTADKQRTNSGQIADKQRTNDKQTAEQIIKDWIESIGGNEVDVELANLLLSRARGCSHPHIHISSYQGEVTITPTIKHHPPDYKSIELMLKWRGLIDAEKEKNTEMPSQSEIDKNREEARKVQAKWDEEQQERKRQLISQGVCFEVDGDELD